MASLENETEQIFIMFRNKNDKIPYEDILKALRSAGLVLDDDYLFQKGLEGKDLDITEFSRVLNEARLSSLSRESVLEAFSKYDPENTGYIKAADLQGILSSDDKYIQDSDIKILLEAFPPNEKGLVCYNLIVDSIYN